MSPPKMSTFGSLESVTMLQNMARGLKTASTGLRDNEVSLECLGGANVIARVLKMKGGGRRVGTRMMAAKKTRTAIAGFEDRKKP